jgi:hypothetical protein
MVLRGMWVVLGRVGCRSTPWTGTGPEPLDRAENVVPSDRCDKGTGALQGIDHQQPTARPAGAARSVPFGQSLVDAWGLE